MLCCPLTCQSGIALRSRSASPRSASSPRSSAPSSRCARCASSCSTISACTRRSSTARSRRALAQVLRQLHNDHKNVFNLKTFRLNTERGRGTVQNRSNNSISVANVLFVKCSPPLFSLYSVLQSRSVRFEVRVESFRGTLKTHATQTCAKIREASRADREPRPAHYLGGG